MKTSAVLLALLTVASGAAYAQQATSLTDADPLLMSSDEQSEVDNQLSLMAARRGSTIGNEVNLTQVGDNNAALVDLRSTGIDPSTVQITQGTNATAASNNATLNLLGNGNNFSLTQDGSGNVYNGDLQANRANLTILQQGDANAINQEAILSDDVNMTIRQLNGGNTLNADGYNQSIQVTQSGNANATLREIVPATPR